MIDRLDIALSGAFVSTIIQPAPAIHYPYVVTAFPKADHLIVIEMWGTPHPAHPPLIEALFPPIRGGRPVSSRTISEIIMTMTEDFAMSPGLYNQFIRPRERSLIEKKMSLGADRVQGIPDVTPGFDIFASATS
ncbi:MAG: hypothetical protein AAGI52_15065 [Bacteroidota bacterium]